MAFTGTVYKVMIASPSDVAAERDIIRDVIHEWNVIHAESVRTVLLPVSWESHSTPAMGDRAQAIINKQVLASCDLLVAVFWTKIGSPTGKAASGTVEEIEEHLSVGKPAMVYFSTAPVRPDSVDQRQYKALAKFKNECYKRGLVEKYDSLAEFHEKLSRQLAQTIIRDFDTTQDPLQRTISTVQNSLDSTSDPQGVARLEAIIRFASATQPGVSWDNVVLAVSNEPQTAINVIGQYRLQIDKAWNDLFAMFARVRHLIDADLMTDYLDIEAQIHSFEQKKLLYFIEKDQDKNGEKARELFFENILLMSQGISLLVSSVQQQLLRIKRNNG